MIISSQCRECGENIPADCNVCHACAGEGGCEETCPIHGTPMLYAPSTNQHACQDPTCRYAHGTPAERASRFVGTMDEIGFDEDPPTCPMCDGLSTSPICNNCLTDGAKWFMSPQAAEHEQELREHDEMFPDGYPSGPFDELEPVYDERAKCWLIPFGQCVTCGTWIDAVPEEMTSMCYGCASHGCDPLDHYEDYRVVVVGR